MLLLWSPQEEGTPPPPATPLAIITLGFSPGGIANIVWFGFGGI